MGWDTVDSCVAYAARATWTLGSLYGVRGRPRLNGGARLKSARWVLGRESTRYALFRPLPSNCYNVSPLFLDLKPRCPSLGVVKFNANESTGDDRVCREHAEQAGGRLVVLDLLHGGGVHRRPGFLEGAAPQDLAQVRWPRLPR